MYNLGINTIVDTEPVVGWSEEQLFELDQSILSHFDAVINLCTISDSIKKYGKTQQLKDLVGPSIESAGITFSMEGLWQGIKDFFKWIWDKIEAMWNWFKGLFTSNKKKEAAAANELAEKEKQVAADGTANQQVEVIDAKALANVVSVELPKERLPFLTLEYLIKESIDNIDAIYAEKEKQIDTVKKVIEDTKQLGIAAMSKITTTKNVALNASRGLFGVFKKGLHWLMEDSDDMKKVEQNVAKFNGAINNNKIAENDTAKMAVAMKAVKQDYQYVILKTKVHQANVDKCIAGLLKIVNEC